MAMLLVPGFMLDADLWRDVVPALTEYGPATYADLSQDDTITAMAHRALADAPSKFVLVGFSMGGYVAREIARQAADRVAALVLIATSARGDSDVQRQRKAAIAGQTGSAAFKGLSRLAVASSLHPDNSDRADIIARIQAAGQRLGGDVFRRQSLIDRRDERDDLGMIGCPSLVIAGEQDQLRSREEAIELHRALVGSSFEIIENTGHMVPMEAPQRLAAIMREWLAQQPLGL
ncbi:MULTISPECIES: alpha/beta hydrolase [unclassified Ensifer]|uniref:alpha/beta fold hydrolase n=1 Tax=unclassified Ensifer TaxID=2633371 RepID=UPI000813C1A7|nr:MULTISPECIES: alpha/beta hydrolase [unclassified Ensifer]OCP03028.1 alpha/beta hydrolase [Ensifer sp. LC14]OCP08180.1 alpha/beta hydrolase [Ensifer sp. LC11]OCP08853.1 alpha/beta hydrolase [Ensifer sp. LC13]OCP32222.1 alpha/beta hydrolase [Ensifer sp. LC499]